MFFISMFLQIIDLLLVAVAAVFMGLLFQLITLPVEFNASNKVIGAPFLSLLSCQTSRNFLKLEKLLSFSPFTEYLIHCDLQ